MKILIDINHPAHVHVFKNLAKICIKNSDEVLFTTMKKDIAVDLLKSTNFNYKILGQNRPGLVKKIIELIRYDYRLLKVSLKFKPDIYISHGSVYASFISFLMGKPHIGFEDTEHAKLNNWLSHLFTKAMVTPISYKNELGEKQIRYNGNLELAYLHKNYFVPDPSIFELLKINPNEKYVIIRFVSGKATHDLGIDQLTIDAKVKIVKTLASICKVFISSEGALPDEIKQYQFRIPPHRVHDALFYATLFIGESNTMVSESTVMGTPAININNLNVGYCEEEASNGLCFLYTSAQYEQSLQRAVEIAKNDTKKAYQELSKNFVDKKIDVTAFMVWFVKNYPESFKTMKENPDYQYNFK
jgi:predicted glycosyltransferase